MPYYDSKPPVPVGMGRGANSGVWGKPMAVRWLVAILLVVLGSVVGGTPVPSVRGLAQTNATGHADRLAPAPCFRNGTRSAHQKKWHREHDDESSWRTSDSGQAVQLIRLAVPGSARSLVDKPASDWKMVILAQF
ncbi:hypothetical protein PSEUBRA_001723 [Kalmanozyma brasiliensis GHG001]|uniref:uncharacterized protein n=1 Tax=Kalmanozyma brasiliensis (strain GHG001) TaxID=1365824 RepID=UPI002867E7EA|nr:uncharacterized protein PSEUBRA_001723 [Kalmanozyma brasiliensis GHG001]KAF6766990.1 hypothetical protein PSEUBRA_001723 [Kalmanozyma brasiliensis GHG001]